MFDLFLAAGFDAFFLSRATTATIPSGLPVFSAVEGGKSAQDVLMGHGLRPEPVTPLDEGAGVEMVVWRVVTPA